ITNSRSLGASWTQSVQGAVATWSTMGVKSVERPTFEAKRSLETACFAEAIIMTRSSSRASQAGPTRHFPLVIAALIMLLIVATMFSLHESAARFGPVFLDAPTNLGVTA